MKAAKTMSDSSSAQRLPDWRHVVGFEPLRSRWRALATARLLPSVILLLGRRGIGKSHLLAELSGLVLCDEERACGECSPCRWLLSGRHPDVAWFGADEEARLGVSEAEMLQEHLCLAPESRARIGVIPDADRLTEQAMNRLLKTLEEPAQRAMILLSCSRGEALLPTVKSRTVVFKMPPLPEAQLRKAVSLARPDLVSTLDSLAPERQSALIRRAGGAPASLLALLAQQAGEAFGSDATEYGDPGERSTGEAARIVRQWEVDLNDGYHRALASGERLDTRPVRERRALLAKARELASRQGVPLNAQLLSECLTIWTG